MSLESFKSFVRTRPELIDYVKNKEETWQSLYNIYELYGKESNIWNKYTKVSTNNVSLKDFFAQFKNIDTNELQKTIESIRKGIGYVEGMFTKKEAEVKESQYKPKPIHKYFDD